MCVHLEGGFISCVFFPPNIYSGKFINKQLAHVFTELPTPRDTLNVICTCMLTRPTIHDMYGHKTVTPWRMCVFLIGRRRFSVSQSYSKQNEAIALCVYIATKRRRN